jgi:AraC family transcriptional regulator
MHSVQLFLTMQHRVLYCTQCIYNLELRRPNGKQMNAYAGVPISPEPPMCEARSNDLSVVAAQLVEAACRACDGDREAARAHIAHAVALLHGKPSVGPSVTRALSMVQRQVARGGLTAWQTRRLVAHVDANYARRIRVAELAELLGLSTGHFSRAFKGAFGVAPHTYVLRRRIEVAQGLMLTPCEPLSSIALTCGMCDQSHFTHLFHRFVGETPGSWRRNRRSALEDRQIGARAEGLASGPSGVLTRSVMGHRRS